MSRNRAFRSFGLIFGTFCTSAVAVPIFSNTATNGYWVTGCDLYPSYVCSKGGYVIGLGTESVAVDAAVEISVYVGRVSDSAGGGAEMYTDGPIAPAVLNVRWSGGFDGSSCMPQDCVINGSAGGSVWNLETGTPVLVYSWSSAYGAVALPFKLGIPFAVGVNASLSVEAFSFPPGAAGGYESFAAVSIQPAPIPEPGSLVVLLTGVGAVGALTALRRRNYRK